jgi:LCP family protein required for cell wall assembly
MAGVLVAIIGVGAYVYIHLNGNINTAALLPPGASQAAEIPNQFGQTPLNVLLIGSDTRATATDCHLGGACQPSLPHADVEMVMHLSADRSNMTVMSIPRDSIVDLPACARGDGAVNLVNSALNFGPGCQVEAIHELTGLTIDDFIEVDMGGVVALTNALGPVPVCVKENIYDPDSHLKLPAGTSNIQGVQALEWLRTRHAFLNEVVREEAQHLFMSAMVRKLKANASLTHITTLYSVADTATKSLTVSPALGSVTSLLSLAQELGKVPTERITMLSVPTEDYTGPIAGYGQQLQFQQPAANNMFAAIKADTSYTAGTARSSSSSAPAAGGQKTTAPATYPGNPDAVNKAGVSVSVLNGNGTSGRASDVKATLTGDGFRSSLISTSTAATTATTAVYYPSSRADSASAVASALGIPASAVHLSSTYGVVTVVIGKDWASGGTFGAASSGGSGTTPNTTAVASSPPSSSLLTNGSDEKTCLEVQPNYRW